LEGRPYALSDRITKYLHKECKSFLPTEANKKRNLNLTQQEFKQLVKDLQNGDETLIEKMYLAHFGKCIAFLRTRAKCTHFTCNYHVV